MNTLFRKAEIFVEQRLRSGVICLLARQIRMSVVFKEPFRWLINEARRLLPCRFL